VTDPLRIYVSHWSDGETIDITPELARKIWDMGSPYPQVDIFGNPAPVDAGPAVPVGEGPITSPFRDDRGPIIPPAYDAATVQALVDGMKANTGTMHGMAIGALDKIRRGSIPGISEGDHTLQAKYTCAVNEVVALRSEILDLKRDRELTASANKKAQSDLACENRRLTDELERAKSLAGFADTRKERDEARHRAAELEAKLASMDNQYHEAARNGDRLAAELAKFKDETERHIRMLSECVKEREEARAELAALRVRKVTLPGHQREDGILPTLIARAETWNRCLNKCAEAIRAAGVEVSDV
jgi:hypothetical protein